MKEIVEVRAEASKMYNTSLAKASASSSRDKEIVAKDKEIVRLKAIITELAETLDELSCVVAGVITDIDPSLREAQLVIKKKAIRSILAANPVPTAASIAARNKANAAKNR